MPSDVQIVPKWSFPHEETYINDNTSGSLTDIDTSTVIYPYMFVFGADRGIDNKFVKITSSKKWTSMFGKTNYKKYGQPNLMPTAVLSQSNTVCWCMRVMPDDALYANSVLSLWYKADVENQAFRIKFTTKNISVDSGGDSGVEAMTKILSDRDKLIDYASELDGTPVDGVYVDDEGYTQVPLVVFSSIGRGKYGQNLRWRIVADEDYERDFGLKVYRFEILDVTDGVVVADTRIGSLVSSGKTTSTVFINDVIADNQETITADIHVFESNFEDLYEVYKNFCNEVLEANPSLDITIPDVDEFDPLYGLSVKDTLVRVTPAEPFISFTQPLTSDVDTDADGYDENNYSVADDLATLNNVAGNNFSGGSDGSLDTNDATARQAVLDECYIAAFNGKYDKLILAPRRVESVALFDANYSMNVKLELVRLGLYRQAAPVYLDTNLRDTLGTVDINTLEADLEPINEILEDFAGLEEAYTVSVNTHYYYIKEPDTGKRIPVTMTYWMALTDATHRKTYGETTPRVGKTTGILTGHVKNSLRADIAENENDLKEALYNARINYFEDEGDNQFVRATQSMYVKSESQLLEETNVIALYKFKRILEDECRDRRYTMTNAKKRSEFRDYIVDKYSYLVGDWFETLDIQYKSNAYEQRRNITHMYAAVTFPQMNKITLIEIDVNEREYESDDTEE
jgi:hypothetical protein